MSLALVASAEVDLDLSHELLHGVAPVVPGDVGMQVLPDPFDAVVIRTVGR